MRRYLRVLILVAWTFGVPYLLRHLAPRHETFALLVAVLLTLVYLASEPTVRNRVWSGIGRRRPVAAVLLSALVFAAVGGAVAFWLVQQEARTEAEIPRPFADPKSLAYEQVRARLALQDVRLLRRLKAGETPEIELTIANVGASAAEQVTRGHLAIPGPSLPKWQLDEFIRIGEAHGQKAPESDPFYGTSIEPRTAKGLTLSFPNVGALLDAFGPDYVRKLGQPVSGTRDVLHVYFVGYFDYSTLGKKYRLKFCYTPKVYSGTELVEAAQWNGTDELPAVSRPEDRESRRVVADVRLLSVKVSPFPGKLQPTSVFSAIFANIGPTPAHVVTLACFIGTHADADVFFFERTSAEKGFELGARRAITLAGKIPLSDLVGSERVAGVTRGEVPLIFEARLAYTDAWNVEHSARFVQRYNPTTSEFEKASEESNYNWPNDPLWPVKQWRRARAWISRRFPNLN